MPISDYYSAKWDARLYNWLLWRSANERDTAGAKISSIYSGEQFGSGYRESGNAVLSGEAMDTDALLQQVRREEASIFEALVAWTVNDGTRGTQASRLSVHVDTYRDRVDTGKRWLERLSLIRSRAQAKNRGNAPERV